MLLGLLGLSLKTGYVGLGMLLGLSVEAHSLGLLGLSLKTGQVVVVVEAADLRPVVRTRAYKATPIARREEGGQEDATVVGIRAVLEQQSLLPGRIRPGLPGLLGRGLVHIRVVDGFSVASALGEEPFGRASLLVDTPCCVVSKSQRVLELGRCGIRAAQLRGRVADWEDWPDLIFHLLVVGKSCHYVDYDIMYWLLPGAGNFCRKSRKGKEPRANPDHRHKGNFPLRKPWLKFRGTFPPMVWDDVGAFQNNRACIWGRALARRVHPPVRSSDHL
eukprot:scaffold5530_cov154-Pinguiococcus_pyrenoidosus.AAC.4